MAYDEVYLAEIEMTEEDYWTAFFMTEEGGNVLETHKRLQAEKEREKGEEI